MKIIISRGEQTFGPYTSDQAKGFLESGELLSNDLATREGAEEWTPLESLLSSLSESEQEEPLEDEESLDDFDHEKMKQWEDVFVDDEDDEVAPTDSNQFIDDDFPDEEVSSPESAQEQSAQSVPPPIPEAPVIPEAPAVQVEQTVIEPLPVEETASAPEIEEDQTEDPEPPPPPPAPAAKRSKAPQKSSSKEDSDAASSQSITPRSKRIKGLNRRQTVIVVKGQSVFSKIYTTSLIFLILFIIACLIAIGGLFFSYESVAPVLEGMGLPSGIIETFEPQKQTSGIESDENGFVLYSASCLTSFSEKNKSGGG